MKSAYELAMERLKSADGDAKPISDALKAELAEIDERYRAKIAEREIFLKQKLDQANAQGQRAEGDAIRKQMANERARLEEEREEKKEKARQRG